MNSVENFPRICQYFYLKLYYDAVNRDPSLLPLDIISERGGHQLYFYEGKIRIHIYVS